MGISFVMIAVCFVMESSLIAVAFVVFHILYSSGCIVAIYFFVSNSYKIINITTSCDHTVDQMSSVISGEVALNLIHINISRESTNQDLSDEASKYMMLFVLGIGSTMMNMLLFVLGVHRICMESTIVCSGIYIEFMVSLLTTLIIRLYRTFKSSDFPMSSTLIFVFVMLFIFGLISFVMIAVCFVICNCYTIKRLSYGLVFRCYGC